MSDPGCGPTAADDLLAATLPADADAQALRDALTQEQAQRRRAECSAEIQADAVQLALDLLVREPNVAGFFRVFMQRVMEDSESHACGVWLLSDDRSRCDLWMANVRGTFYSKEQPNWDELALPRESMAAHLHAYERGWTETTVYAARDPRLPEPLHDFNETNAITSLVVSPLVLPTGTLGWVGLASSHEQPCEVVWRRALVDAMARQGTGGALQLAAVPTFATRWLIPRLPGFARLHADVTIHIETRTRPCLQFRLPSLRKRPGRRPRRKSVCPRHAPRSARQTRAAATACSAARPPRMAPGRSRWRCSPLTCSTRARNPNLTHSSAGAA